MFKGLFTALVTPFNEDYSIDFVSFERLLQYQKESGVDGVVVAGSTGESSSILEEELRQLLKIASKYRSDSFKIIASIGTNNTASTCHKSNIAQEYDIDGIMAITPYYNRPTEDGILEHFRHVAEKSELPIILYNAPNRTSIDISDSTTLEILSLPNVCCIKDASGDINRPVALDTLLQSALSNGELLQGKEITQLSGEDSNAVAFNAAGGNGLISVSSNVIPATLKEIQNLTDANNFRAAAKLHAKYFSFYNTMFCETNPIPIKYAAFKMGLIKTPTLRLPLVGLQPKSKAAVEFVLKKHEAIVELNSAV